MNIEKVLEIKIQEYSEKEKIYLEKIGRLEK
jgi:hypothetical protein